MAREVTFRCDVCGSGDGVETWKITNGVTTEVDLCVKHGKPLRDLAAKGRKVVHPAPGRKDPNKTYDPFVRGVE